jgi:hypothetical protein
VWRDVVAQDGRSGFDVSSGASRGGRDPAEDPVPSLERGVAGGAGAGVVCSDVATGGSAGTGVVACIGNRTIDDFAVCTGIPVEADGD